MRDIRDMSRRLIPLCLLLSGCGMPPPWSPFALPPDTVAWDCSIVRWDRGQGFCRLDAPLPPPEYCSRALGGVDCWADPAALPNRPRALADNPPPLLIAPFVVVPVPPPVPVIAPAVPPPGGPIVPGPIPLAPLPLVPP